MRYEALFKSPSTMEYYGEKEIAEKFAKLLDMEITEVKRGHYTFKTKLQAVIYEFDQEWDDEISDQCDPYPFLKNTNPDMKNLTKEAVKNLVKLLNEEKVDFDDVCDAACHLR